jgi:hypothetical protein
MGKKVYKRSFELAPEGTYPAIIIGVADLGIQESKWEGQPRRQLKWGLNFELSGPATSDGKPFSVATTVTDSLHPKSRLYPVVKAALGAVDDALDMESLLGKTVLVTIEHEARDDRTYANVVNVSGLPAGMEVEATDTPLLYFDLDSPDSKVYEQLPALFKKRIEARVQQESIPEFDDVPV